MAILAQILTEDPPAPSLRRPDLDPRLEAIWKKAMARKPEDRYATMSDLAAALADYLRSATKPAGAQLFAELAEQRPSSDAQPVRPGPRTIQSRANTIQPTAQAVQPRSQTVQPPGRHGQPGAQVAGKRKFPDWKWIAAGAAVAALVLGAILYVTTNNGTVRIELSDSAAQVEIKVDDKTIDVKGLGEPLRFRVGKHELIVMGKDYETVTQAFTVRRGKNEPLKVSLKPALASANKAGGEGIAGAGKIETLFNGKDLTGWTVELQDPKVWRVEDGILAATGSSWKDRSFLLSEKQYASYILRFEFQLEENSAGGVVIRAIPGETNVWGALLHAVIGYGNRAPFTGALVWARDPSTRLEFDNKAEFKPAGEWNAMEIKLHGQALRVTINGTQVMNLNMTQIPERGVTYQGLKRLQGHVGFLKHTGTVRYRKIEIQELLNPPVPSDIPSSDKTVVPVIRGRRALVYGNQWRIDGQELVQGGIEPFRRIYFGDASWTDYDYTFEAKKVGGEDGFAVIIRAADVWNYYIYSFGAGHNTVTIAESFEEGTPKVLRNSPAQKIEDDRWYRVRISMRGITGQCFLDDQLDFEWKNAQSHTHGGVGLQTWNTSARFRNFKVTDPDGKVLFDGLPELPPAAD